jgi:hypothetical protein
MTDTENFLADVPTRRAIDLISFLCALYCSFISVSVKRDDKSEGLVVGLYCIQRNDWVIVWLTYYLCLKSLWGIPACGKRCEFERFLRIFQKEKVSNYSSTTVNCSLKLYVWCVGVLHFLKNKPIWKPVDITVTLLICVRLLPRSIYSKYDFIPVWTLINILNFSSQMEEKVFKYV